MSPIRGGRRPIGIEALEERRCLSSVGWDGPGLGAAELSYYVGTVPGGVGVNQTEFEAAVDQALAAWSEAIDVSFEETQQAGQPDSLDITFNALDGPGGTLAQAYFPDDVNRGRIAGDIQIDSSESWELGNAAGNAAFDLVQVLVHEIGHALGLEHSNSREAILFPSISASSSFVSLSSSDVAAALQLYAPATSVETVEPPTLDVPSVEVPSVEVPTHAEPDDVPEEPETRTDGNRWQRTSWQFRWTVFNGWSSSGRSFRFPTLLRWTVPVTVVLGNNQSTSTAADGALAGQGSVESSFQILFSPRWLQTRWLAG